MQPRVYPRFGACAYRRSVQYSCYFRHFPEARASLFIRSERSRSSCNGYSSALYGRYKKRNSSRYNRARAFRSRSVLLGKASYQYY